LVSIRQEDPGEKVMDGEGGVSRGTGALSDQTWKGGVINRERNKLKGKKMKKIFMLKKRDRGDRLPEKWGLTAV